MPVRPFVETGPVYRFAPSPNGALHLGHAYSALLNHRMARANHGRFLLRLEDIDIERCSEALADAVVEDCAFLGLDWDGAVRHQSQHFADYATALEVLVAEDLVYPAFMSRGEIRAHVARHEEITGAPWPRDPDGAPLYPSLDRTLGEGERAERMASGARFSWRLDMAAARARTGALTFDEHGAGPAGESGTLPARPQDWGDVVVARRDVPTSYHLAVVLDDAAQGVTDVVRGRDLFMATGVQRLLQALLRLPAPRYHHHDLILDAHGRKLSKSAGDTAIASLRRAGMTGADIARMVGLPAEGRAAG